MMDLLSEVYLVGSSPQQRSPELHLPVTLLSTPTETLAQIFITLIYVDEHFTTSVVSLAATCKRLYVILYGTRTIWTEMFATCFDLLEHHKSEEFDIQQEYKSRRLALNPTTQVQPDDKNHISGLVSENEGHNVQTLIKARGYAKVQSLLCDFLSKVSDSKKPDWELLAVVEILVSVDKHTANAILSNGSVIDRLDSTRSPGTQDNAHRAHDYLSAQCAHLSVLYLLVRDPSLETLIPPPIKIPTTSKLLKTAGVSLTHYFDVPHALELIPGNWTGYYRYRRENHLDNAMRLILSVSETVNANGAMATEPSATLTPQGTRIYNLWGQGMDEPGPFTIDGFIWSTGEVCFTKLYIGGHSWVYRGRLLPWGIAGTWDGHRGSFWIWKDGQEVFDVNSKA